MRPRGRPLEGLVRSRYQSNAALLNKIESRYGVPGEVVVAIWGLETSFGANTGNMSSLRSLATLAYDCRRSAFFTNELMAALSIVQRGDMSPSQMVGAWAGELGQTQFLASSYVKFAVDFDGNGRRDLIRSKADALASTANYLKAYGWKKGQVLSAGLGELRRARPVEQGQGVSADDRGAGRQRPAADGLCEWGAGWKAGKSRSRSTGSSRSRRSSTGRAMPAPAWCSPMAPARR